MTQPRCGTLNIEGDDAVNVADEFKAYDVRKGNECNLHHVNALKYNIA